MSSPRPPRNRPQGSRSKSPINAGQVPLLGSIFPSPLAAKVPEELAAGDELQSALAQVPSEPG